MPCSRRASSPGCEWSARTSRPRTRSRRRRCGCSACRSSRRYALRVVGELDAIFANPTDDEAQELVDELIDAHGWPPVRDFVLSVLEDPDRTVAQWQLAAAV